MEITPEPHPSPALSRGRVAGALLVIGPVIALVFVPTVLGLHRYVVADDAMEGERDGSVAFGSVALTRDVPASELRVGDVITFRPPVPDGAEPADAVTRRVVALHDGVAVTRGDHRDQDDPWRLEVGEGTYPRVVASIPWLGQPFARQDGRGGWVLLVVTTAAALVLSSLTPWRRLRRRRLRTGPAAL